MQTENILNMAVLLRVVVISGLKVLLDVSLYWWTPGVCTGAHTG